jgi:hypothetical protein
VLDRQPSPEVVLVLACLPLQGRGGFVWGMVVEGGVSVKVEEEVPITARGGDS